MLFKDDDCFGSKTAVEYYVCPPPPSHSSIHLAETINCSACHKYKKIRPIVLVVIIAFASQISYSGTWADHYSDKYKVLDDQYFEFNDQGFSEQKSINGYLGADAIEGKRRYIFLIGI